MTIRGLQWLVGGSRDVDDMLLPERGPSKGLVTVLIADLKRLVGGGGRISVREGSMLELRFLVLKT